MVDDSHGVGAFGHTGRGTEEVTGSRPVDILVGTLGKAFGVNGGYVVASSAIVATCARPSPILHLFEPDHAGRGGGRARARSTCRQPGGPRRARSPARDDGGASAEGLTQLGLETLAGEHPVVPLMVRDSALTARLVAHLRSNGILATGLNYPVVPKGEEEIRFQVSADHTALDIDEALVALERFKA